MTLRAWHYPVIKSNRSVFRDRETVHNWCLDKTRQYVQKKPDGLNPKPQGLWLSLPAGSSDSWADYCSDTKFWPSHCWRYPIEVHTATTIPVYDPSDVPLEWLLPQEDHQACPEPNWARFPTKFSGVIFPTYEPHPEEDHWWNSLSAASACIWDLSIIGRVGEGRYVQLHNGNW